MKRNVCIIAIVAMTGLFIFTGCKKDGVELGTNSSVKVKKNVTFPTVEMQNRYDALSEAEFNFEEFIQSQAFCTFTNSTKQFVDYYLGANSIIYDDRPFYGFMVESSRNMYETLIDQMKNRTENYNSLFLNVSLETQLGIFEIVDYLIDDDYYFKGLYRFWSRMAFANEYSGMNKVYYVQDIVENVKLRNGYSIVVLHFSMENEGYKDYIEEKTSIDCQELATYPEFIDIVNFMTQDRTNFYTWTAELNNELSVLKNKLKNAYPNWGYIEGNLDLEFIVINGGACYLPPKPPRQALVFAFAEFLANEFGNYRIPTFEAMRAFTWNYLNGNNE